VRTRDCFGYMEPSPDIPDFAQCGSCKMWLKRQELCYWLPKTKEVEAGDSCILYVQGAPFNNPDMKATGLLQPEVVGFIDGKVRCENCSSFSKENSGCNLFHTLTQAFPTIFKLNSKVKPRACCNAWNSKKKVTRGE